MVPNSMAMRSIISRAVLVKRLIAAASASIIPPNRSIVGRTPSARREESVVVTHQATPSSSAKVISSKVNGVAHQMALSAMAEVPIPIPSSRAALPQLRSTAET